MVARTRLSVTLLENCVSYLRIRLVRTELQTVKITFTHPGSFNHEAHDTKLIGPEPVWAREMQEKSRPPTGTEP